MNEKLEKFKDLLKEIFEIDKSDLNFGIYRIINLRKDKIEKFINDALPNEINNILNTISDANKAEELATDVYSALYNFFNRYYDEGDFISKRRYKEGVYAIPYEGEEVKLYWANYDQYYIKTSEDFKDYEFKTNDGITCKFKLIDVTTEQNNNKEKDDEKRKFMLYKKGDSDDEMVETFSYDKENKVLTVCFIYDIPESKNIHIKSDELEQDIKEWIDSNVGDIGPSIFAQQDVADKKTKTLLKKHLDAYIAKNTFDYFIHKDLKKFLDRELDFFIKTEIMHLDDLNTENEKQIDQYILKVKAIKKVAQVIIDFLASVENFQKKLWLKKKFIIETNWCISLDKISDEFYEEIRNNKDQINEWIDLYAINEIDGFTETPSIEFLKNNNNLIIDTKNFSKDFKERLLATIENLDDNTNGLLINGDNFHAIRILQEKYRNRIQLCYIDPPYNTDSSPILYKNNYKDSSWNSLIADRINEAKKLLMKNGLFIAAIDDVELRYLINIFDQVFSRDNYISTISIVCNPQGRVANNVNKNSDYHLLYAKDINSIDKGDISVEKIDGTSTLVQFKRTGTNSRREERPNRYYPILVKNNAIEMITDEEYLNIYDRNKKIFNDDFVETMKNKYLKLGYEFIVPKKQDGTLLVWQREFKRAKNEYTTYVHKEGTIYTPAFEREVPKTCWVSPKYANPEYGTEYLKSMMKNNVPHNLTENTAKSIYTMEQMVEIIDSDIVLDFFAGSGTTGHACINKQRLGVNKRYILCEIGKYFNNVTLVRIKKAIYSNYWADSKPIDRKNSISQIVKYYNLESYEDALSNIKLNDNLSNFFIDNIEYMIDLDTKDSLLSIDKFKRPFDYKMKTTSINETKETNIDMVETFNYLIGLTVLRQYATRYFNIGDIIDSPYKGAISLKEISFNEANNDTIRFKEIYGILRDGRKVVILWRDINDNLENSNAALDAFFINHMNSKEFEVLFINGDNNVQNLKKDNDNLDTELIEQKFNELMFEEE